MLFKINGRYPRIWCQHCRQMKQQDHFKGHERIDNNICEECDERRRRYAGHVRRDTDNLDDNHTRRVDL